MPGSGVSVSLAGTLWVRDEARRHAERDYTRGLRGGAGMKGFYLPLQPPPPPLLLSFDWHGSRWSIELE